MKYIFGLLMSLTALISVYGQKSKGIIINVSAPDTVTLGESFSVEYRVQGDLGKTVNYKIHKTGWNILSRERITLLGGISVLSPEKAVYVKMASNFESEYEKACVFMMSQGINLDTCHISVVRQDRDMTLFVDDELNLSVMVANRQYFDCIDTPVLYWSTECSARHTNQLFTSFMSYYRHLLRNICSGQLNVSATVPKSYDIQKTVVKPLLGDIRYDTNDPYNFYCPIKSGTKINTGSLSVACGQIMAMYKHPDRGSGSFLYETNKGLTTISKNFDEVIPDWDNNWKPDYKGSTDSTKIKAIGSLLNAISISTASYSGNGLTYIMDDYIKASMINFWGYAASMQRCVTNNLDTLIGLIHRELDASRVPLVTTQKQMLVCDGCHGDYLHLNMGWGGMLNGYYFMPVCDVPKNVFPIDNIIVGIEPDCGKEMSKNILLSKPNTLRSMLSDEEQRNVTALTIEGKIGNDDILLLRQMLGAPNEDLFQWSGKLRDLNLEKAAFKYESNGYYMSTVLHGKAGYSWWKLTDKISGEETVLDVNTYDYDNMDANKWQEFVAAKMNRKPGSIIKFKDGVCTEYSYVSTGLISPLMFSECENLRTIVIPEKTTIICTYAFVGCKSLVEVVFPKKCPNIHDYAFAKTIMLKGIKLPSSYCGTIGEKIFYKGYPGASLGYK